MMMIIFNQLSDQSHQNRSFQAHQHLFQFPLHQAWVQVRKQALHLYDEDSHLYHPVAQPLQHVRMLSQGTSNVKLQHKNI